MSAPLIFLDTETTGLSLDDDIWELAAVRRDPDGTETELHVFIEHDGKKCAMLPDSFRDDHHKRYDGDRAVMLEVAMRELRFLVGDDRAHVVGAVPNFDTERIAAACKRLGMPAPKWHYHLIDVENLVVGFLHGADRWDPWDAIKREDLLPPWSSDGLCELLEFRTGRGAGEIAVSEADRHTAMGDVRWVMRMYDAVMGAPTVDGWADQ